jgi:membrane protease YdiL (CAAX protease family)
LSEQNTAFPNARDAILLVVALFALEYLIGEFLFAANGVMGMDDLALTSLITLLANGGLLTAVLHYKGLTYRQLFHSGRASMTATLLVLSPAIAMTIPALLLVITSLVTVVASVFPLSAAEVEMFDELGSGDLVSLAMTCLLAPVLEEMLFRGVILRSFLQQYPRWPAIVGTAVLFGVAHMNIYQFGAGLVLGLYVGWLYERTRSLLPCIALHACYNTTLMTIAFDDAAEGVGGFPAVFWAAALVLGVAGIHMLRRMLLSRPMSSP